MKNSKISTQMDKYKIDSNNNNCQVEKEEENN